MAATRSKYSRKSSFIGAPPEPKPFGAGRFLIPGPIAAGAFIVLVASVTDLPALKDPTGRFDVEAEKIASQTVRASFALEAEDLQATRERRDEAAAQVPEAYSVDLERVKNQMLTFNQRINTLTERRAEVAEVLRQALLASNSLQHREEVITNAVAQLAAKWREEPLLEGFPEASVLTVWLTPRLDSVPRRDFGDATENVSTSDSTPRQVKALTDPTVPEFAYAYQQPLTELGRSGLEYVLTLGVLQRPAIRIGENSQSPLVQILRGSTGTGLVGDLPISEERPLTEIPDLNAARTLLRARIVENAKALAASNADASINWDLIANAAFEMAALGITDTLAPNQVVTEGNRQRARNSIEPVVKMIERNQIIQQEGYRWTQQSRADAQAYWNILESGQQPSRNVLAPIASSVILVALILFALFRATPLLVTKRIEPRKAISIALLIMCGTVAIGRVMAFIEPSGFVVPCVASAILLAILTNTRVAVLTGFLMALLVSIQYGQDWRLLLILCAMTFAGVSSLYLVRKRSDMTSAAIAATLAGLVVYIAVTLDSASFDWWASARQAALIGLNGAVCVFLVPGLLSPLEKLFGTTTDIQLLEYSDLNNDLLRRLAIEIPATYAHSLMLGQLAEAAADAIGANGLLARVAAYYHDIGKLRRPEYFIENQTGQNIHDELSPRLSARAIASHVSEGVEMAREYHLPEPIIAGIREHHGTCLIGFFYKLAMDQQKHGDVREEDYRYPGPKPQSRETAILMICDGVESGVRSIKNPNAERIQEFVGRIIQARSEDRQFDECDLTLKDLDTIGDVVAARITSTHHTRIAYPEKMTPEAKNVIPLSGTRDF